MLMVGLPKSFYYFQRGAPASLTPEAQERYRWWSCWLALRQPGVSGMQARATVGLPRSTLYRRQNKLKAQGP